MPSQIPAVSRALSVFEMFAREQRELTNSEIARLLSVAESSCSDLLHTLHTLGYLTRTPRSRIMRRAVAFSDGRLRKGSHLFK